MKFHIVGNGESVDDILRGYDISIDELKNENKHIRIWNYLIPGTKLKIPVLTESILEELHEVEPFIEDYYPKLKVEEEQYQLIDEKELKEEQSEEDYSEIFEEEQNEEIILEVSEEINIDKNIQEDIINQKDEIKIDNVLSNINNKDNIQRNNKILLRYLYPQPIYYCSPIIYVVPRKNSR